MREKTSVESATGGSGSDKANAHGDGREEQKGSGGSRVDEFAQFAYTAVHNLKEPARAISIFAERLQHDYSDKLDERGQQSLSCILEGVRELNGLVDDLFAYSQTGAAPLVRKPVPLRIVFNEISFNLQKQIQESGASLTCGELPAVMGDRVQLTYLLEELLENAIKFRSDRAPKVEVTVVPAGPGFEFSVKDNGIGFDPGYSEAIFKLFKRLHGRDKYPGNGVGLAICQKIVERHGGRIWAETGAGQGSVFHFTLPGASLPGAHSGPGAHGGPGAHSGSEHERSA